MSFISNVVNSVKSLLNINQPKKPTFQQAVSNASKNIKPAPKATTYDDINRQLNRVQQKLDPLKDTFWNKYAAVNNYKAAQPARTSNYSSIASAGRSYDTPQAQAQAAASPMMQYIQPEPETNWGAYLPFINNLAQSTMQKNTTPISVDLSPYLGTADVIRRRRNEEAGIYG